MNELLLIKSSVHFTYPRLTRVFYATILYIIGTINYLLLPSDTAFFATNQIRLFAMLLFLG